MKVGILGTGDVGQALGKGFAATGHTVKMGSRSAGGGKARAFVKEAGAAASEGTFADAAGFAELIVFAVRGTVLAETVAAAGAAAFAGKVVIDATNPLDFSKGFPPGLAIKGDDSAGEQLQRLIPDAKVVKAFNTAPNALMFRPTVAGGPPSMFIAGNDAAAKATVTGILTDFGWETVDIGLIDGSRYLEAMCIAWVRACAPANDWRRAFKLVRG